MQSRRKLYFAAVLFLFLFSQSLAQISSFPYSENFDASSSLPAQWSVEGFKDTTTSPKSKPNCIYAKGNKILCILTSPAFDFTNSIPDKITFWESRTKTAVSYRLRVSVSTDGVNFDSIIAEYDTISSITSYVERTINLSDAGLERQSHVQFRWQLLADSLNATGKIHLDDFLFTAILRNDISLSNLFILPFLPNRKDSLSFSVVAKNLATDTASEYSLSFFLNANGNVITEPSERFLTISGPAIAPGDSIIITVHHASVCEGHYCCIAVVSSSLDENHFNDTTHIIFDVGSAKGDVLVNEIMYYPASDEQEWVELFNNSSDTISIKNWRISDNRVSTKSVITQTDVFIPPCSYLVVAKDINFPSSHPGIPVVIANFSALYNSKPDAVVIYDSRLNTIDSVMYAQSWGGRNGKSLERIDLYQSSTIATNWGTSQDSLGSTPGRINSIARLDYDLMVSNLTQKQTIAGGKVIPVINASIRNIGRRTADSIMIKFYSDKNCNGVPEPSELIHTIISTQALAAGDSILFSESFPQLASGVSNIIVVADWWRDERLQNNRASVSLKISYEPCSIVINEIMYDPLNGQNEWFELFNRSSQTIDLAHWTFNDKPTSSGVNLFEISNQPLIIRAGEYVVVTADSSIFKLFPGLLQTDSTIHVRVLNRSNGFGFNNDGDAVVLKDITTSTIDSVMYQSYWGGQNGKSLERIDVFASSNTMTNWETSQDTLGSTPGKINSIARMDYDLCIQSLRQTQTVVSGETVPTLSVVIENVGRKQTDSVIVHFYLDKNHNGIPETFELEGTFISSTSLAAGDSIVIHEFLSQLPPGETDIIVMIDYWRDERKKNNQAVFPITVPFAVSSIIINEIMAAPFAGDCEWLELYNRGSVPVDIAHWTFHDLPTASGSVNKFIITTQSTLINPHDYAVIAADSSIMHLLSSFVQSNSSVHVIIINHTSGFGFNNDADVIVLQDLTGKMIDSMGYHIASSGQDGRSLERIDVDGSSMSATNWGTSQDSLGSTPGRINSIARLDYDLMVSNLTQKQTIAGAKVIPVINASIRNIGRRTADSIMIKFYSDKNCNGVPEPSELIHTIISTQALAAGDSILFSESFPQLASGVSNIIVVADWWRDERLQNNRASVSLKISYEPCSIVINEIMYDPLNGQNEWFELFNRSSQTIDLAHWTFNDKPTSSGVNLFEISNQPLIIRAGEYVVVTADSSIFKLFPSLLQTDSTIHVRVLNRSNGFGFNNDGDAVVLKDITTSTIDSVAYLPSWHNPNVIDTKGRSLERINPNIDSNDPRNWSTCTNILGGTPGKVNSIITVSTKNNSVISISPNPFSPDGDGFEDFCIIRYNLPLITSTINLKIYDIKGRLIRTLANGELAGMRGEIIWDGFDNNKQRARIGVYVVFLEATDQSSNKVITAKAVAVVATKL